MLAPLKDRSVLERVSSEIDPHDAELLALRLALRDARSAQRQSAIQSARKIVELTNDIHRLTEENQQLRQQRDEFENGQIVVALGQQLMALRTENDALLAAARRVCRLNHGLRAAHAECKRLSAARENALVQLQRSADSGANT